MTWFLKDRLEATIEPLTQPVTDFWDEVGGSARLAQLQSGTWNPRGGIEADVMDEMETALGGFDAVAPRNPTDYARYWNPATRPDYLMERAQDVIRMAPEAWGSLPQNRAQFDGEADSRYAREVEDLMAMQASGSHPWGQFLGQMIGSIGPTDVALAPFGGELFAGGKITAKALAKFALVEGGLGAVGEVPHALAAQDIAEKYGWPAPNVAAQIAIGAVANLGFAGAVTGAVAGGRAVVSAFTRRAAEDAAAVAAGRPTLDTQAATDRAEEALRAGREPPPLEGSPWDAVPNGPAIRNGIFAGESGGDYDGLFGYSNRPGGPFGEVRLTEMTVDEALAFADPNGAYAGWVRGQIGRTATPMGAYQVVGTTLRAAKEGLRLTGNEVMTPALQDRIGVWIYHTQGTGAWVGYRGPRTDFVPQPGTYSGGRAAAGDGTPGTGRSRTTLPDEVVTPTGTRVKVTYRVFDAEDLIPASGDLQPRDRSRAASGDQVNEIKAGFDPGRLMPGPETDRGAPLVGPDNIIESGNGRVMAIKAVAAENPEAFGRYVQMIREQGFDVPEGIKTPVLVAQRTEDLPFDARRQLVRESNLPNAARMSATEQARFDADYIGQDAFDAFKPGKGVGKPDNAEFVRRVFSRMSPAERGALMDARGGLNVDGRDRLLGALFARAFNGAPDLLQLALETESRSVTNLIRMLQDIAPEWAAFRAMIDAGMVRREFDITEPLMEAVRIIAKARADGRDGQAVITAIRDRLAQGDMFAARDPLTEALIDAFYRGDRARGVDATQEILERYAGEAVQAGRRDMADLTEAPPPPEDVLARAIAGQEGRTPFEPLPARVEPPPEPATVIAAMDPAPWTEGTAGPAAQAADAALAVEVRDANPGPFGPVFHGFRDDPEGAIAHLMQAKAGEVPDAFLHPQLGEIAFVYGKTGDRGYGLAHIAEKHGADVVNELPAALRDGVAGTPSNGRVYIDRPGDPLRRTVVKLEWEDQAKTWVVTSHDRYPKGDARQARTTDVPPASAPTAVPEATGPKKGNPADPPAQDRPTDFATDMAAALEAGDGITVDLPDGAKLTAAEALEMIEAERQLDDVLEACRIARGAR